MARINASDNASLYLQVMGLEAFCSMQILMMLRDVLFYKFVQDEAVFFDRTFA